MMTLWQTPALVLTLVTWLTSPPTSLAEISQREAMRKSLTAKSAGSYTNENLRPDMFPVRLAEPTAAPPAEGSIAGMATAAPTTTASGVTMVPASASSAPKNAAMDEKAWRARMGDARATLERNQGLVEALQTRVNSLQTDVVMRDDPAQQAALRQTLAKTLSELERLKAQVTADQKAISDIQTEARKANVPPGWVR
jgi:hypothetical protein